MNRRLRHIVFSALLCAVWIATPLLSAAHVALEAHTYCAEHGVLEEGRTHHASMPASEDADVGPAFHASKQELPGNDSHTVCAFGEIATHDVTPHAFEVAVAAAPTALSVEIASFERSATASSCVLRSAPKTSPPQAA